MYLQRIELDMKNHDVVRALSSPALFHGALEIPGTSRERKLWRIDTLGGKKYFLCISKDGADLSRVLDQFGTGDIQSVCCDRLFSSIKAGDTWRFRLTANPCRCVGGKWRNHVTVKWQQKWFLDRAEKHGFSVLPSAVTVSNRHWVEFRKGGGSKVQFASVDFEGILTVTDVSAFVNSLCNGIGREKAYGQGLMTVMPL